ncbi:MAG: hypothetical protein Ct9H300mP1_33000 [Planctomycetaceae bacterium]|nr:MAG: hypothetical protein Ct9H300mP1_33000 [Planctomycetaceae bacterium]
MRSHETKLKRRDLLKLSAAGLVSGVSVPWFETWPGRRWPAPQEVLHPVVDGRWSQPATHFRPETPGRVCPKPTSVPGIHIVEHLPQLAQSMEDLVLVRSMTTEINGHYDAKYFLHTGYKRTTAFEHPSVGCVASSQVSHAGDEMPAFVTIDAGFDRNDGGRLYRNVPGYLGPSHAPLLVNDPNEGLENLTPTGSNVEARLKLLARSEDRFAKQFATPVVGAKQAAFNRAVRLMQSRRSKAFDVDEEPESLRQAYGKHKFGRSCLLARRLVEAGVSFVEVVHRGWDDHAGAAKPIAYRAPWMDAGMATLIADLKVRGMLDDTLVIWMGEFGRTPGDGNGHFSKAWSTMWAGGGLKTGQVIGKTSGGKYAGAEIAERPVTSPDFIATLCLALWGWIPTRSSWLRGTDRCRWSTRRPSRSPRCLAETRSD